jgi:hypothetical protein
MYIIIWLLHFWENVNAQHTSITQNKTSFFLERSATHHIQQNIKEQFGNYPKTSRLFPAAIWELLPEKTPPKT